MIEYAKDYTLKLSKIDDGVPAEGKTFEDEELEKLKAKYDRMPMSVVLGFKNKIPIKKSASSKLPNEWDILNLHTYNEIFVMYDPAQMVMHVSYRDSRDRKDIQAMWERNGYDRFTPLVFHMM